MSSGFDQLSGVSLKLRSAPGLRMTGDYLSGKRAVPVPGCLGYPDPTSVLCAAIDAGVRAGNPVRSSKIDAGLVGEVEKAGCT